MRGFKIKYTEVGIPADRLGAAILKIYTLMSWLPFHEQRIVHTNLKQLWQVGGGEGRK